VPTAAKGGLFTIHQSLIMKSIGRLSHPDAERLERSLRDWLGLQGKDLGVE